MTSLFTPEPGGGQFRLQWRGYDRAQVDEFLRRAATERQRLEERLARLEVVGMDTADLNASFDTLRKAARRLSGRTVASQERRASEPEVTAPPTPALVVQQLDTARQLILRSFGGRRLIPTLATGAGLATTVMLLYPHEPSWSLISPPAVAVASAQQLPEPTPAPTPGPIRVVERSDGLELRLTALQTCWIRASIDGGVPLERLLNPDETITLQVRDEVVLRVGDAAALSLLINNRSTRPLGASGKAVTVRITPSSYATLLNDDAAL